MIALGTERRRGARPGWDSRGCGETTLLCGMAATERDSNTTELSATTTMLFCKGTCSIYIHVVLMFSRLIKLSLQPLLNSKELDSIVSNDRRHNLFWPCLIAVQSRPQSTLLKRLKSNHCMRPDWTVHQKKTGVFNNTSKLWGTGIVERALA